LCGDPRIFDDLTKVPQVFRSPGGSPALQKTDVSFAIQDATRVFTRNHAVLDGYQETLKIGGSPFVLAEHKKNMEKLGIGALKPSKRFWANLDKLPAVHRDLPRDAKRVLQKTLPASGLDYKVVRRAAGLGSLGQQRFVAIANWEGGHIAREAKAMLPSACVWLNGREGRQSYYPRAIKAAIRAHDPFQKIVGAWLIRRLSPDSNPIEIADLPKERDEEKLLHAIGVETANVHLGSKHRKGSARQESKLVTFRSQEHGQSSRTRLERI
jgi:hypothetical protein